MAFTATYRDLRQSSLSRAIHKLMTTPFPTKTAYQINKITQRLSRELEKSNKLADELVNTNCVIEDGKVKRDAKGAPVVVDAEKMNKEYEQFLATSFEIDQNKLSQLQIINLTIEPEYLEVLGFMIEA